jgi:hypothetical protein
MDAPILSENGRSGPGFPGPGFSWVSLAARLCGRLPHPSAAETHEVVEKVDGRVSVWEVRSSRVTRQVFEGRFLPC